MNLNNAECTIECIKCMNDPCICNQNLWYGRIGFDNEVVVKEVEFETKELAEAYVKGAIDMKEQSFLSGELTLKNYWAVVFNQKSTVK